MNNTSQKYVLVSSSYRYIGIPIDMFKFIKMFDSDGIECPPEFHDVKIVSIADEDLPNDC